ncbi:hypothetical protein [Desulfoluna spongiiphila]|uniref:hypothetical protein n=1 Tax=Desulfoluna spongiiphila TaxID=419481 RepID=UPI0012535416|nr:hypothetical protein [Desulfoluna spongiiphila]VVS93805.1 prokaryotic membrane lipoprotein lipid attachment site profile [Desulfoluna spongiiphila]
MRKISLTFIVLTFCFLGSMFSGCASITKDTIQLSVVTEEQTLQLQASHIKFVQRYYQKLRDDVDIFMTEKWTPLFLSKAVKNKGFRKDLDDAYLVSSLDLADIEILIKGKPAASPYKEALISGIDESVTAEQSRLGQVLLAFSKACQAQINKKRAGLMTPINQQEAFVVSQLNASYADLLSAQASITAYLQSALDVKENQDLVLKKLGALKHSEQLMDTLLDANDELTDLIGDDKDADVVIKEYKAKMADIKEKIKESKDKLM